MRQIHHLNISINDNSQQWLRYLPGAKSGSELDTTSSPLALTSLGGDLSLLILSPSRIQSVCVTSSHWAGLWDCNREQGKPNAPCSTPDPPSTCTQISHGV